MLDDRISLSPADGPHPAPKPRYPAPIGADAVKNIFSDCDDFFLRDVRLGLEHSVAVSVCWIDGIVSEGDIAEDVLRPLTDHARLKAADTSRKAVRLIQQGAVYRGTIHTREAMDDLVTDLTAGHAALIFEALHVALTFEVKTTQARPVSEAAIEKSVKGPRDAFVETLRVNTSLVRRRLRTPKLKLKETTVGRQSGTPVSVFYIEDIAEQDRVQSVLQKLEELDIDALLGAGDLEPYLAERPKSPFPQLGHTERPDKFAAALLQGRVGILADGLPVGFLLPGTLPLMMHAPEDEADHYLPASGLTLLRWLALVISLTLPAIYVAIAVYHREMIPTKLLYSVVQAEQEVPFSTATVMVFLLIAFELLQEAGLRLPAQVGQTVSIIGALLVGEAAVSAKIASPIAIIVVALAGIGGYNVPNQELSSILRFLRLGLVLSAVAAGLFGVTAALAGLGLYLCTLETAGVAYLSPFVDSDHSPLFRTLLRKPQQAYKFRDPETVKQNRRRQK